MASASSPSPAVSASTTTPVMTPQGRADLEAVLKHRGFFFASNEIHHGPAGFFDLGPVGCAIEQNLLAAWRKHFVEHNDMLEIKSSLITPSQVFEASGHTDRFTDWMVNDLSNGVSHRADKLLEEACDWALTNAQHAPERRAEMERWRNDAGSMTREQLQAVFDQGWPKAPGTGGALSPVFAFNLMFATQVGPNGASDTAAYLRPETAQGAFVNAAKLLEIHSGKLPMAVAQVGQAFRNEIAPRQGLLRVREFTLAEVEHFYDSAHPEHEHLADVTAIMLPLVPRSAQEQGDMVPQPTSVADALEQGCITNPTLAYYLARTQLFLLACGIHADKLRFRQHRATEMAHYAQDCWDCEALTSYGWVEVVGCADRAAYDLDAHSKATGADLTAEKQLAEPRQEHVATFRLDYKQLGKQSKRVTEHLATLDYAALVALDAALTAEGHADLAGLTGDDEKPFKLTRAQAPELRTSIKLHRTARFTPHVIEPAFGAGRIFHIILEHSYSVRPAQAGDVNKRTVMHFPAHIAPTKVYVLPLSDRDEFAPWSRQVVAALRESDVSCKVDASAGAIGKRYSKADEIGVPLCVTIDFETAATQSIVLRERDSMQQLRVPIAQLAALANNLTRGRITWAQTCASYPQFGVHGRKGQDEHK
jgi:glycyl-tRNA synthetase